MAAVVVLVILLVVALLAGVHWYVWRRLVRDTTARGGTARRLGTAAIWLLPLLSVAALTSGRVGAPFWLERVLAWPGYLWLAVLLYLVLALLVGEGVSPLLRRVLDRRASAATGPRSEAGEPSNPSGTGPAASAPLGGTSAVRGTGEHAGPHGTPVSREAGGAAHGVRSAVAVDIAPDGAAAASADRAGHPASEPAAAHGSVASGGASGVSGAREDAGPDMAAASSGDEGAPAEADPSPTPGDANPERPRGGPAAGVSRRLFVSRVVGGAAAAAALGTVGYGTYGVLRGPRVKRVTVPLAKLPRAAHGYRIAVVSDIHLGPILGRAHTQRIVDSINAAQPDLVAVVGDLVDGSVADLGSAAEPLAQLRSRHGSFFVTGNHEYFSGADEWVDHVRELGLRPLRNERVEIAGGFDLAGVDDVAGESEGHGPDFVKALGDRDRTRAAVLLAHQPVVIHDAVEQGVDLQLSGHTHGGQLWPGNHLAELANPTVAGLERYGDTQLYVTRGAGAWGPPVRVGAASDITLVQLASRQA
ncbi:metallophosphoesterase [Streptomyces sp. NPDC096176]|uniref:metallophosphoesterase n=1 Tax=Streptomyces sp. NPDC096176 TaxID=3366079 RepID=UPI00382C8DA4